MALRIKSSQDFWTGCAFMAFGAGTVALAQAYPLGSAARMGPAYFPTVLGALLAGIGLVILLKSLASAEGGNVERVHAWLLVRVLLSVAAFAVLLNPLGLVADGRHRRDAGGLGGARIPVRRGAAQRGGARAAVLRAVRLGPQPDHAGLALVPRRLTRTRRHGSWDLFGNLALGLATAASVQNLFYCFVGVLLGTLIGVLPGIGPVATIAMLLPITYALPPTAALIMLAGIYYGAQYGGSTTAILVNLPGEASSVVTCIDGYQMARQGRAGPALAIAAIASFIAGTVATLICAAAGRAAGGGRHAASARPNISR